MRYHNVMIDSRKVMGSFKRSINNDPFLYRLLCIFNFGQCKLNFFHATCESCIRIIIFLWLPTSHFQHIKMSDTSVFIVLSKYVIAFSGNVSYH